ncbi:hypothetical protein AKJ61_03410 [candidate division MSBL1 archaeon SCGC-AAA259B11]|uniref:Uncharacterized protein n=1 Tax=candidate division MSBL1 archaeon SCGC-AAA259B11 TaxID=1698260 RepID=A0A133U4T1_9EURY|nr:hypothetical protein AKJ61_03410 [candidate division MSBL1 archaeon SCGC-AAA259B11]
MTLEGKEKSSDVQVKAELQGPATKGSELEKLEVNVGTLFKALKIFGIPRRVEVQREDGEMRVCSLNPSRIDSGQPVGKTLPVKKPDREESSQISQGLERTWEEPDLLDAGGKLDHKFSCFIGQLFSRSLFCDFPSLHEVSSI